MYFINPLFFEFEPVKIPSIAENGSARIELARFIGIYEKECLIKVLGSCLYKEVIDSLELLPSATSYSLKLTATIPIKNLVNGLEYDAPETDNSFIYFGLGCGCGCESSNCKKKYWKGFVEKDEFLNAASIGVSYRSFIADYIYYQHKLINRTTTSGTGESVLSGENASTAFNESKRIDRWNEFVFKIIGRKNETSLYRFLKDNKTDYPTWEQNCQINFKTKY